MFTWVAFGQRTADSHPWLSGMLSGALISFTVFLIYYLIIAVDCYTTLISLWYNNLLHHQ